MLGQGEEDVRAQEPALGVLPANECLGPHDVPAAEVGLRLEEDDELLSVS